MTDWTCLTHGLPNCPVLLNQCFHGPAPAPPSYDQVSDWLRAHHLTTVGGNVRWSWSCSCGAAGVPTTQGRAAAGRDRHLQAARRRYRTSQVHHP